VPTREQVRELLDSGMDAATIITGDYTDTDAAGRRS
jgi:hypothetical protein